MGVFVWPEADILQLRALWSDGKTTAQIAREMNRTKNSIIGQARRSGCAPRPNPCKGTTDPAKRAKRLAQVALPALPSVVEVAPAKLVIVAPAAPRPVIVPPVRVVAPPKPPRAKSCQFPLWGDGRPTHQFCGAETRVGSYCGEHAMRCYAILPRIGSPQL